MSKTSLPLKDLRGLLLLLILAFHSFSAYIVTQPAVQPPFDQAPDLWRSSSPILDNERWIGFDLFGGCQFIYLMQFMFFLSGLFVWSSLQHRGWKEFLAHRFVRLGIPFVVGVYLLMPIAFYPVYRVTAIDPSLSAFWAHWTALPVTPTGSMWFLWYLIALDLCAVLIYWLAPHVRGFFAPVLAAAMERPVTLFAGLICISALAYLPLSAIYSPWDWVALGPFEIQASFGPQYLIYFLFGVAVGGYGYGRGPFRMDGPLVRRWPAWAIVAFASFFVWLIPTALIEKVPDVPVATLRVVGDFGLVMFVGTACFSMTAVFQRFVRTPLPIIDEVSEHGYGVYFFHYPILLWLQYALLGLVWPAIAKGVIVLAVTVVASLAASMLTDRLLASGGDLLARRLSWLSGH
jgi:peptidoglycan/LPS O-acetylase OafA/YrhL